MLLPIDGDVASKVSEPQVGWMFSRSVVEKNGAIFARNVIKWARPGKNVAVTAHLTASCQVYIAELWRRGEIISNGTGPNPLDETLTLCRVKVGDGGSH